ncbi:MAG: hypothetical protein Q8Q32_03565 [bacterium]|nr:hypothetical protein [bacterium]
MKKAVGILLVIFVLSLAFAFLVPDQRDLGPAVEDKKPEAVISEREIQSSGYIEYALLGKDRYLAILDPNVFEGERHGGTLTIFDTLNGAIKERINNVASFTPIPSEEQMLLFSARTGSEFALFSLDLETGLSATLDAGPDLEMEEAELMAASFSDEENLLLEANNIALLSHSSKFILRINQ